jgi:hypothetical protein
MIEALKGARERRPAVRKISTVAKSGKKIRNESTGRKREKIKHT